MANHDGKGDGAHSPAPRPLLDRLPTHPLPSTASSEQTSDPGYPRILPFTEQALIISFGQAVRAARLRRAMTQEKLAEKAGMRRNHISRTEHGTRNVRFTTVCVMAYAMRMNPGDLMPVLFQPDSTPVPFKALPLKPSSAPPAPPKPRRPTPPAHL